MRASARLHTTETLSMLVVPLLRAGAALGRWLWRLTLADTVARERRTLAMLDDRLLRDIGVDRATAHAESAKHYWDLPADRLDEGP